ncbi:MAG: FAD-dependent oxidoreductase [Deltaproteobacteria bacterium]|nr:FAD-dependent oxidoreductase [Deltaproteobacteria bacterium]
MKTLTKGLKKTAVLIMTAVFLLTAACDEDNKPDELAYYDVVIVGGGMSGLTAAYKLRNLDILVIEKEEQLGGRIQSGEWNGYHYAKGTEYLSKPEGAFAVFLGNLSLETITVPPPTDAVGYEGTVYYGSNILGYLTSESDREAYETLQEEVISLNKEGVEDEIYDTPGLQSAFATQYDDISVAQWLSYNDYPDMVQTFTDVENRGLFGAGNSDLSFYYNIPEIAFNMPDAGGETMVSSVYTFEDNGIYAIVDALQDALSDQIITGAEVTDVQVATDETALITYRKNGQSVTVKADVALMATPAPVTAEIVSGGLSNAVEQTLADIQYAQYVTINLFTNKRYLKEAWAVSALDSSFVTIYDAVRTQVATDHGGKSILGLYIAPEQTSDTTLIDRSDDDLVDDAIEDLAAYYPDIQQNIESYDVCRHKYAFPVFDLNYNQKLNTIYSDTTTRGPIILAGDYMIYATIDGAFWSGIYAAEETASWLEE